MNIRKLMKEKVSRVSISSKMSIVMTVSIVLILTVFLGVNRYYNSFFVYQKLENASLTYLDSIDRMMENLVDTLDGYSRICFSNAGVQELLDKNSSGQVDFSLQDKLTMVNWPAVSGADGDQNSFVGGASATLVASATSAHKKEAVEFMTFMSEHFSNYAYEEGAILPTWKYSGDMELKPFQQTLLDLMQGADGFCLAWDTLLDPETADVHSTSLQGIYAQQMTADDYVEAMAATR